MRRQLQFACGNDSSSLIRFQHALANHLDQYLDCLGVAEKRRRAGAPTVGAGLKHDDQIADFGVRNLDLITEQVERRNSVSF